LTFALRTRSEACRECQIHSTSTHPQPRVQKKKAHELVHHRYCRIIRLSPRNGFTTYSVLSPAIGLSCHRRRLRCGASSPTSRQRRGAKTTRLCRTRISAFVSCANPRPSHPAPNVRDDRETPLMWARDVFDSASDFSARSTAAHWHDGQITPRSENHVK
jgi:hypothetical protein